MFSKKYVKRLLLCAFLSGCSVLFGVFAFTGTLSEQYLIQFTNSIIIVYVVNTDNIGRYLFPIVSMAVYSAIRIFQQSVEFVLLISALNIIESLIGALLMKRLLMQYKISTTSFVILLFIEVSLLLPLCITFPGAYFASLIRSTTWHEEIMTYFMSHVLGNFIGLYTYYAVSESVTPESAIMKVYVLELAIVVVLVVIVNAFAEYYVFSTASIILITALTSGLATRHGQIYTAITNVIVTVIVFLAVILDRGPFVSRYGPSQDLATIVTLYAFSISSSLLSTLLSIFIQQRADALQSVTAVKDDVLFISSQVSHDIRAPLMHVMDVCSTLQEKNYSADDVSDVQASCEAITGIMDTWLTILRSSNDESTAFLMCNNLVIDMPDFFKKIVQYGKRSCRFGDKTERLKLVTDLASDIPSHLVFDGKLVYHVIVNLVSNAVKYTDTGTVTLKALLKDTVLTISIIDTGRGIRSDQLDSIFKRFYQTTDSKPSTQTQTSRTLVITPKASSVTSSPPNVNLTTASLVQAESHGVGLAIVERLVRVIGGKIHVSSIVGQGSTFTINFPVQMATATDIGNTELAPLEVSQIHEQHEATLRTLRILIAEDDIVCLKLFRRMLSECASLDVLSDGAAVIPFIINNKVDVLALDGMLPGMSGVEILSQLEQLVREGAHPNVKGLAVVTISGLASISDIDSDGILTIVHCGKPFNKDTLKKAIMKAYSRHSVKRIIEIA